MIKSRITRIIAGVISCVLVGVFVGNFMKAVIDRYEYDVPTVYEADSEINEIYRKLWIIAAMYLRNTDENGNFNGSEYLEKQTISALQKLGCMDAEENLTIGDTNFDYEYSVSYGTNKFSNTDKSYDELDSDYTLMRRNDGINYPLISRWWYSTGDFNMYDTNYGMHYYYINGNGVALFDFDTTGLDFYIDELGATMYYKTDGSTPVPDLFNDYDDYDYGDYGVNEYSDITREAAVGDNLPNDDGIYIYNANNRSFIRIEQDKFRKVQVQEMALTIAIKPDDAIIADWENYHNEMQYQNKRILNTFMNFLPLLIIAFALAVFVFITGGYNTKEQKFCTTWFEKVFAEIPIMIAFVLVFLGIIFIDDYSFFNFMREFCTVTEVSIITGIIYSVVFGIVILMVNTLIIRLKCHCFMKSTFVYNMLKTVWGWIRKAVNFTSEKVINVDMLRDDKFTRRFIVRTIVFALVEAFFATVLIEFNGYFMLAFMSIMMVGGYIALSLLDLCAMNRVSKHISAINQGDYTPHKEDKGSSAYCMTEKLNNISAGIQSAVDRQIQSERMKIDLVTNVSHDLKTPLTSIISYIDLLSSEELSPEARDYVTIIENKSQRLKSMVADLFDLAKATSRTDVDMEKIDAVILTKQVLADLSDKIESTGRQIKVDIQADSSPVMAEGKKMYRVLQNVIDNALKYSLDGTRIYLTLKNENGYCFINVKNIASYEMTFNPDEIMERFTRGDESRSTEGNGLGLSIAKSFTEACGGNFSIKIDGDLFIAEVKLPINIIM